MIFRIPAALLLVAALSTVVVLILVGSAFPNTYRAAPTAGRPLPAAAKGKDVKKLFKQHCIKCHGSEGTGDTPFGEIVGATDFTDAEWQERVDDQKLINSMTYGLGGMPAFGKKLSKEQITSLLA